MQVSVLMDNKKPQQQPLSQQELQQENQALFTLAATEDVAIRRKNRERHFPDSV